MLTTESHITSSAKVYEDPPAKLIEFSRLATQSVAFLWSPNKAMRGIPKDELPRHLFWKAWADGSYEPIGNLASIGGVLLNPDGIPSALISQRVVIKGPAKSGSMESERQAMLCTLQMAVAAGARRIEICMDSQNLLLRLLRHEFLKSKQLQIPLELKVEEPLIDYLSSFDEVAIRWIPRSHNQLADCLSKRPAGRGTLCHGKPGLQIFNQALYSNGNVSAVYVSKDRSGMNRVSRPGM